MVGNIGNPSVNLILRPLTDINDPTWSVILSILLLLVGVGYTIVLIMKESYRELKED